MMAGLYSYKQRQKDTEWATSIECTRKDCMPANDADDGSDDGCCCFWHTCVTYGTSVCGLLFGVSVLPAEKRSILARVHMNVGTKQCSFCARKERKSQAKERV